jgi:type VI secretion system secreted protein Hcp
MTPMTDQTPRAARRSAWKTALVVFAVVPAVALLGWSRGTEEVRAAQAEPVAAVAAAPQAAPPGVGGPVGTQAAADYYLKIEGVEGEVTDRGLEGAIQIESWSWGATQQGSMGAGSGGGAGKVSFQDFHFTMSVGKASPQLFKACATGQHIKKAVLFVRKAGGGQQDYLVVTFEDILVSSFQSSGDGGAVPTEQVSLNFAKVGYDLATSKGR